METDANGGRGRVWQAPEMGTIHALVVAPLHARRFGFPPGHVYVLHESARHGINHAALSEFTPAGAWRRTFTGGEEIATRLAGVHDACFSPDGPCWSPRPG